MDVKMEESSKMLEEKLRENCCIGDEAKVKSLIDKGVNVNAANRMNGWTPLHWAAKRGHKNIVEFLLKEGASKTLTTKKGETPSTLASNPEVKEMIDMAKEAEVKENESLPIVPNYLKNPGFVYMDGEDADNTVSLPFGLGRNLQEPTSNPSPVKYNVSKSPFTDPMTSPPRKTIALDDGRLICGDTLQCNLNCSSNHSIASAQQSPMKNILLSNELVLKLRVANFQEEDFIEVELNFGNLTYESLIEVCCSELEIERESIRKVRKLPNTIVRKDKDVARMQQFQELEIVLHSECL